MTSLAGHLTGISGRRREAAPIRVMAGESISQRASQPNETILTEGTVLSVLGSGQGKLYFMEQREAKDPEKEKRQLNWKSWQQDRERRDNLRKTGYAFGSNLENPDLDRNH